MSRKTRRRIKRRKRDVKYNRGKNCLQKHLDSSISNKWTRLTTYIIIGLEVAWIAIELVWFIIDMIFRTKGL